MAKIIYVRDPDDGGNDANAGTASQPKATFAAGVTAAAAGGAGSRVILGPGVFTIASSGVKITQAGISVLGAGVGQTVLQGDSLQATHGAQICPGSDSLWEGLTIINTATSATVCPFGRTSSSGDHNFTNVRMVNCEIIASSDCLFFEPSDVEDVSPCELWCKNVRMVSNWDGVACFHAGAWIRLEDCTIVARGNPGINGWPGHVNGVTAAAGRIELIRGDVFATGGTDEVCCVSTQDLEGVPVPCEIRCRGVRLAARTGGAFGPITAITASNDRITAPGHGLKAGMVFQISGADGLPNINGTRRVLDTPTTSTFRLDAGGGVALDITSDGSQGTWSRSVSSLVRHFRARGTTLPHRIIESGCDYDLDLADAEPGSIAAFTRLGGVRLADRAIRPETFASTSWV